MKYWKKKSVGAKDSSKLKSKEALQLELGRAQVTQWIPMKTMSMLDMFRMFYFEPSFLDFQILAFLEQHRTSLFLQIDEEVSLHAFY